MRASILLVVIVGLFAASQALDLKEVGKSLVDSLVQKGKEALVNLGQSLLSKLTGLIGKRHIESFDMGTWMKKKFDAIGDKWSDAKEKAGKVFSTAMDKLMALKKMWAKKIADLKDTKEVEKSIDAVVDEHKVEHKRIISDLIAAGKNLLGKAVEGIKGLASKVKAKASELVSGLLQKGTDMLVGKRATLGDHLSKIGGFLSGAVAPFKDIVAGLGSTLKGHFSNLVDTVKGHAQALAGKLSGHVDDLKNHGKALLDHGKNALGALSEAVGDILKQTVSNAQPNIDGIAKTAAGAGETVLNHFTGGSN